MGERGVTLTIPFGCMLSDSSPGSVAFGDPKNPSRADYLYGLTQRGDYLVLKDAVSRGTSASFPGNARQTIGARYLLAAKGEFDPSKPIAQMELRLRGLEDWLGETVYSVRMSDEFRVASFDVNPEPHVLNFDLLSTDEITVRMCHSYTVPGLSLHDIVLSHSCLLSISLSQARRFEEALEFAHRISWFFTLCEGFHAAIESVRFSQGDDCPWVCCYAPLMDGPKPSEFRLVNIPFSRSVLRDSAGMSLQMLLNADPVLLEIVSLFVSASSYDWKLPVDLKFIAASQVLEALSKYHVDLTACPSEKLKSWRKQLKKLLRNDPDREFRDWVYQKCSGNMKGQAKLLKELVDKHSAICDQLMGDKDEFTTRQTAFRNRLTHRDGTEPVSSRVLYEHTEGVLVFSYGVILEYLGVDPQLVRDRVSIAPCCNIGRTYLQEKCRKV